ncbi:ScbR family autoregulator-binding transcription factor [Streptomyces sp. NPDC004134]|uniref:ScbR family autoregulator-binding transcription factor n=1 Tax=Streptomyces sp. NPDC004134 TaxID=3364691 RepID=UPI0036B7F71A
MGGFREHLFESVRSMAGVRQARAMRTRQAIITVAAEVFDEYGYDSASLSRIVQRAGTTMGGLYFHFESKQTLAKAVLAAQGPQQWLLPPGANGLQQLIDVTMRLAHELRTNVVLSAGLRLTFERSGLERDGSTLHHLWTDHLRSQMAAARAASELLPEVDEAECAHMLMGAYFGIQVLSQATTGRADLPERVAALWRYLLPGMATAAARERLEIRPYEDPAAAPSAPVPPTRGGAEADG